MSNDSLRVANLLKDLDGAGLQGHATVQYIRERGVHLGFHDQPTAARWRLGRRIELHPRFDQLMADTSYAQSLIIHEVCHLRQGFLTALSVYGEMEAWQAQFSFLKNQTGHYHDLPDQDKIVQELMSLSIGWDLTVLRAVRGLMQAYAGRQYRVDLLPLYPFHLEAWQWLTRKRPAGLQRS